VFFAFLRGKNSGTLAKLLWIVAWANVRFSLVSLVSLVWRWLGFGPSVTLVPVSEDRFNRRPGRIPVPGSGFRVHQTVESRSELRVEDPGLSTLNTSSSQLCEQPGTATANPESGTQDRISERGTRNRLCMVFENKNPANSQKFSLQKPARFCEIRVFTRF